MRIIRTQTPEQLSAAELTIALKSSAGDTLLLLSGGSSLGILSFIDSKVLDQRLTIGMLDERFSLDPKVNNFSQLCALDFYTRASQKGCSWIDSRFRPNESLDQAAQRLERELRKWKEAHPAGKILITLGIGPDGHTSGIMPFPEDEKLFNKLFFGEQWVVGYDAKGKNEYPERLTVTATFLIDLVDTSITYIKGENKRPALEKILASAEPVHELPGRLIHRLKNAVIVTDIL